MASDTDLISIVDADPDLADLLDESELIRARRQALTRRRRLSSGHWDVERAIEPDKHHRGFLMIDGLMTRDVTVLGRDCVELLGAGDVLRPVELGRRRVTRSRRGRMGRARADSSRGPRSRLGRTHEPVAAAWRRALCPWHPTGPSPGRRTRDRPSPARRRSAAPDPLAPRRTLGTRRTGGHRGTAALASSAPGRSGRSAPSFCDQGDGRAG